MPEEDEVEDHPKVDPYFELKNRDSFKGVFDIEFVTPRRAGVANVRIVHWRMTGNGEVFYLIDENGSIYNFANINMLTRVGD